MTNNFHDPEATSVCSVCGKRKKNRDMGSVDTTNGVKRICRTCYRNFRKRR